MYAPFVFYRIYNLSDAPFREVASVAFVVYNSHYSQKTEIVQYKMSKELVTGKKEKQRGKYIEEKNGTVNKRKI